MKTQLDRKNIVGYIENIVNYHLQPKQKINQTRKTKEHPNANKEKKHN